MLVVLPSFWRVGRIHLPNGNWHIETALVTSSESCIVGRDELQERIAMLQSIVYRALAMW